MLISDRRLTNISGFYPSREGGKIELPCQCIHPSFCGGVHPSPNLFQPITLLSLVWLQWNLVCLIVKSKRCVSHAKIMTLGQRSRSELTFFSISLVAHNFAIYSQIALKLGSFFSRYKDRASHAKIMTLGQRSRSQAFFFSKSRPTHIFCVNSSGFGFGLSKTCFGQVSAQNKV